MLKLCEGGIAHISTVSGGCWAGYHGDVSSTVGPESGASSGDPHDREATHVTYIVVAGEDGVVRFYNLKFRVEVKSHDNHASKPLVGRAVTPEKAAK